VRAAGRARRGLTAAASPPLAAGLVPFSFISPALRAGIFRWIRRRRWTGRTVRTVTGRARQVHARVGARLHGASRAAAGALIGCFFDLLLID